MFLLSSGVRISTVGPNQICRRTPYLSLDNLVRAIRCSSPLIGVAQCRLCPRARLRHIKLCKHLSPSARLRGPIWCFLKLCTGPCKEKEHIYLDSNFDEVLLHQSLLWNPSQWIVCSLYCTTNLMDCMHLDGSHRISDMPASLLSCWFCHLFLAPEYWCIPSPPIVALHIKIIVWSLYLHTKSQLNKNLKKIFWGPFFSRGFESSISVFRANVQF